MEQPLRKTRELDDVGTYLPKHECGSRSVMAVLHEKARKGIITVGPAATVFDALCLMAENNIGALVVLEKGRVVGVISERDYARKVILIGKSSRETTVAQIMGTPAVTVSSAATVAECMALMTGRFIRHLPVVADGALVGLVSIGDLVKALLADQEERFGRIEAYISGTYPA